MNIQAITINDDWKGDGFGGIYDDYNFENYGQGTQRIKRSMYDDMVYDMVKDEARIFQIFS